MDKSANNTHQLAGYATLLRKINQSTLAETNTMTDHRSGAQISAKAFIQAVAIIFLLMVVAGVLTLTIPAGQYNRVLVEGREVIDPASFHFVDRPDFPVWRWFTAPVEVLWGEDNLIIITIIVFILLVSGAFAVLENSGILTSVLA